MMDRPLIIIVAPSGAGKSSFLDRILEEKDRLVDIITYTTRAPRVGEQEGKTYNFVTLQKFLDLKSGGFFVESAIVHGNHYGIPIDQIESAWADKKVPIMDVDVQGAQTIKEKFPWAKTIFIVPPSIDELRRRIVARSGGQKPGDLEIRLENAQREMALVDSFDFKILNDVFEPSFLRFKETVEELIKRV
ncbi:MAG: guanylate kinase [Pseudomonadota bacterium]|nr:guanylate kinase [Pseudomonadota bacterium]